MSDKETPPEENSDSEDKDSFSKFIDDNLSMDGMPDAPKDAKKAKDDEEPKPPSISPFASRFDSSKSGLSGFPRFGATKSDDDYDFDDDDDDEDSSFGTTNPFTGKSPFSGSGDKDRPFGSGDSSGRFGGGSLFGSGKNRFGGNSESGSSRFGGGNSESGSGGRFGGGSSESGSSRFGSGGRFGGSNSESGSSRFGSSGRFGVPSSSSSTPPALFSKKPIIPKSKAQKRQELAQNILRIVRDALPTILLIVMLLYFVSVFNQYQPDALKSEINRLEEVITQQEAQIRHLQAQLESLMRER